MSKPSPGPSPTASREKIQSGHCNASMERRNLRSHTTRMHVGLLVLEKNVKRTKNNFISSLLATTLVDSYFPNPKYPKSSETDV